MALPLWMLKGLQMPTRKKLGLAAIFLVATSDIIIDIIRTVYSINGRPVALNAMWDILEPSIAVIVSALPTYKALLGNSNRRKETSSYQNLKDFKGTSGSNALNHQADTVNDIELGASTGKSWRNQPLSDCHDFFRHG